jgi:hypothetical protein
MRINNDIETVYVDFTISKLLKELDFAVKPKDIKENDYVLGYSFEEPFEYYGSFYGERLVDKKFQFKDHTHKNNFLKPDIFTVVQWIYENYGIWISVRFCNEWEWCSYTKDRLFYKEGYSISFDSAYLDAIRFVCEKIKR